MDILLHHDFESDTITITRLDGPDGLLSHVNKLLEPFGVTWDLVVEHGWMRDNQEIYDIWFDYGPLFGEVSRAVGWDTDS